MQNYSRPQQGTRIAAILLASIGWLGLLYLTQNILPRAGARWLFFVLLYLAVSGSTIPILQLVNNRLRGDNPEPPDWVSVRQGLWIGLFVTTCAWLQIPRQLDATRAVFLAMIFIVIEIFLRLRERGQQGY